MATTAQQLTQQLRHDFEKLLTLVTGSAAQAMTLDQMERNLFRQVLRLGFKLLQLFLCARVTNESHAPLKRRGQPARVYHSQKPLTYFSIFGKLAFARAYFYAEGVGGATALDATLSLPARCYSDFLLESAELLAVDHAYDKSLQVLQRLLGLELSELALEIGVAEQSQAVSTFYRRQAPFPASEEGTILVAQADGKGVPMVRATPSTPQARRGKGDKKTQKKEAIAIAVYTIEPYPRTAQQVVDALFEHERGRVVRPAPCHKQIFATLKGKDAAFQQLAQWVRRRDGSHIRARVVLTDGSVPLQQQARTRLKGFTLVLDIIHLCEYVWQAGTAIYGETDTQRAPWVETQLVDVLSSRTPQVLQRLHDTARPLPETTRAHQTLQKVCNYLQRNLAYMDYATYLQRGWPIGTGVIEGVCRHLVKDRMELSGMRWTVEGAEALLALRAVNENGDWDAFHAFRRAQHHKHLYGTSLNTDSLNEVELIETN